MGRSKREMVQIQAGVVLLTAMCMTYNIRELLQRFLDTTLTAWHHLKHGHSKKVEKLQKISTAELIRAKAQVVRMVLGKAAVQCLAPGVLYLGLGLGLLFSAMHPGGNGKQAQRQANVFLEGVLGFVIWWTGLTWFLFCSFSLWMFRTGILRN